jgi:hypothetical protein
VLRAQSEQEEIQDEQVRLEHLFTAVYQKQAW